MKTCLTTNILVTLILALVAFSCTKTREEQSQTAFFRQAEANGVLANEGFKRSMNYVHAWLKYVDPVSGLIPRNLEESRDIWNAKDAAADNYPFMVLTSAILDKTLFRGEMAEMLTSEIKRTSRIGPLPDTYSFSKQDFAYPLDTGRVIFGSAEYMKDGLLPLTEWLGASPWSERMLELLDALQEQVEIVQKENGTYFKNDRIVDEVHGDLLQVLSRMYWSTGKPEYLDWAVKIGDHYLLENNRLVNDRTYLRLRDHGCEIVAGLSELYVAAHYARPEKKKQYQKPLHELLDRILEIGRNSDGLLYNAVNPATGEIVDSGLADTWGYTYNAYYTVYLLDHIERYKEAVVHVLEHIHKYTQYDWEHGSSDGYADAIESAINLYNRQPLSSTADWIDSETRIMWNKQQESGLIEGWHGDGNFARTTMMYSLWKTWGITVEPWREDLVFGAVNRKDTLYFAIKADKPWEGKILFDRQRFKKEMYVPLDYPRINQFPQWFTVKEDREYAIRDYQNDTHSVMAGDQLQKGYPAKIGEEQKKWLRIYDL